MGEEWDIDTLVVKVLPSSLVLFSSTFALGGSCTRHTTTSNFAAGLEVAKSPFTLEGVPWHHDKTEDGHPRGGRLAERNLVGGLWKTWGFKAPTQCSYSHVRTEALAQDCRASGMFFDLFICKYGMKPSPDTWAQEFGPVGTMLAQEVLQLDCGSQASFGGKVVVVGLDLEQSKLAF